MKRKNISRRIKLEEIKQVLNKMDLFLVNDNIDKPITEGKFDVYDSEGYYYSAYWGAICKGIHPSKFHKSNPYTIQNINLFLELNRDGEYICVDDKYEGNDLPLTFLHKKCGKTFISTLAAMQGKQIQSSDRRYYKQCPFCKIYGKESTHASVLKQVFKHEYPNTILEDRSCINPKTNHYLPTDIVNHTLKIAIEIQSGYHDKESKKQLDKLKRDFWKNKGYFFYDPDIREYSVLQMIQLFFPNILSIPEYVNMHYAEKADYDSIQSLLNAGKTIKETTEILNLSPYCIHNAIARGVINLPLESKRKAIQSKSLVHLTKDGKFIKEYECLNYVSQDGYALGTIQRVLRGQQKFAYDSFWVYGEYYHNGNFIIPEEDPDKFLTQVCLYNIQQNKNIQCDNMYDAAKIVQCRPYEIYRVYKGDRKSIKGYQVA